MERQYHKLPGLEPTMGNQRADGVESPLTIYREVSVEVNVKGTVKKMKIYFHNQQRVCEKINPVN